MENKGYVIYDNHNVDYDEWYEEFKDWCYDNDPDADDYAQRGNQRQKSYILTN